MAVIDEARGVLVVRIVYDGPALSGKTTSIRALAHGVSCPVTTPAEVAGRTLFFDWVDYVGGLFDGRQIRCQIVSVPGQLELAARRSFLLDTADAVVLVLDTRAPEWAFSQRWVEATLPHCRGQAPPVGLVVQANKRDAPDAISDVALREELAKLGRVAIVPSSATSGEGIREAFVLAVRLALDRVRALAAEGRLEKGLPPEDDPQQLLASLQHAEMVSAPHAPIQLRERADEPEPEPLATKDEAARSNATAGDGEALFVPDPAIPGGMIWPPVDGRMLLHEVASLGIRPRRTHRRDWSGSGSGFRFHSASGAVFSDPHRARRELLEWARLHSSHTAHLSTGRAVVLAEAGAGRLRLWQIVRSEATLRERLASALLQPDPAVAARELLTVACQLVSAREYFATTALPLPCTLWTVGALASARPLFVGLMPMLEGAHESEPEGRALVERELSPQLRELRRARVDYSEVMAQLTRLTSGAAFGSPAQWLAELTEAT